MENWTIINKDKTKCALCSETRILERAHIIPKRFTKMLRGTEAEKAYQNSVVLLCPTHHSLFDLDRLNEVEKAVLKPLVVESVSFLSHFNENVFLGVDYNVDVAQASVGLRAKMRAQIEKAQSELLAVKEKVSRFITRKREIYNI